MLHGPTAVTVAGRSSPPHYVPTGCGGCFANRGKGKRKPNLGGRTADRLNTSDKTRNLSLKKSRIQKAPSRSGLRDPRRIQQHLQKAYNTNKAAFKAHHWVIDPTTVTYNVEKNRTLWRKSEISIFSFEMIPGTLPEPLKIGKTGQRARSYLDRDPEAELSHSGVPVAHDTFFVAYTVNGEFLLDEDRQEMRRLEATGTYTDDEINRLARGGKQRGHILGVGIVLPTRATASPNMFSQFESGGAIGSGVCGDDEESADDQDDEDEDGDGDSCVLKKMQTILRRHVAGTIPGDMSLGNMCHRGTNYLTEKYVGPTISLEIVAGEGCGHVVGGVAAVGRGHSGMVGGDVLTLAGAGGRGRGGGGGVAQVILLLVILIGGLTRRLTKILGMVRF
nr:F-box domain, leucine-rich repeat domain, L domain-like protein [Tanacetum cinerariifolium]